MAEAGTQPPGSVGQTEGWNPSTRAQHPHAPDEGGGSVGGGYVPERDTPQTAVDGITLRHSSVWAEFSCITESEGLEVGKIAEKWKDRLAQHCCICNNWALDRSSVKCHLIRMHAKEWCRVAEQVAEACKAHKRFLVRDTECHFCQKKVYGVERHALQCPVLFQACFMNCLVKAPSEEPDIWHRLRDLTRGSCHLHLQGTLQRTYRSHLTVSVCYVPGRIWRPPSWTSRRGASICNKSTRSPRRYSPSSFMSMLHL